MVYSLIFLYFIVKLWHLEPYFSQKKEMVVLGCICIATRVVKAVFTEGSGADVELPVNYTAMYIELAAWMLAVWCSAIYPTYLIYRCSCCIGGEDHMLSVLESAYHNQRIPAANFAYQENSNKATKP